MADKNQVDLGIEGLERAQEIGAGGFATVFRAFQPAFRRTVAVKVLATPNLDRASRERFERECQAMGTLADHPNIVTILDSGYTRQGRPYLVMAYLPGGSLQDRIDRHGPISWQEATLHAVHLAGALETAHRASIVHRDIKPGNVLLSGYGEAQLTDFGIARISGGHETRSGLITASMAHAPPEVLDGHRPTVAADVYALGSTTFELMLGRPAFASAADESMVPMLRRILTDAPPDLRAGGVPDAVCRALERAMSKSPDQRPESAAELGHELQAARRSLGLDAGRLTVPSDIGGPRSAVVPTPTPTPPAEPSNLSVLPPPPGPGRPVSAVTGPSGRTNGSRPDGLRPATVALASSSRPARPLPPPPVRPSRPTGPAGQAGQPARPGATAVRPTFGDPDPIPVSKRTLLGFLVLAFLLIFSVALIKLGPFGDGETTPTTGMTLGPVTTRSGSVVATDYNDQVEEDFIQGCMEKGNSPAFCSCVYSEIESRIPFGEYVELNKQIGSGVSFRDTLVGPIVVECSKKHPLGSK